MEVRAGRAGRPQRLDGHVLLHAGDRRRHPARILRRHPRERLVFGTDYPIMDPQDEIDALQRRTRFTDSELDELLMNGSAMLFG